MARYLQNAHYTADKIKSLELKYPGIMQDALIYDTIMSGLKSMPRVQGTIKRNYMEEVIRQTGAGSDVRIATEEVASTRGDNSTYTSYKVEQVPKNAFGVEE